MRWTSRDLRGLGERIMVRKKELLAQFEGGKLPPPETRSFTGHKMTQGKPVDGVFGPRRVINLGQLHPLRRQQRLPLPVRRSAA